MTQTFGSLPLGTRFTFRGRAFQKIAISMAEDDDLNGNIFVAETEVEAEEPSVEAEGNQS